MSLKATIRLGALAICVSLLAMCRTASAGTHTRIRSSHGPIHVWMPDSYDPETAGVVVYVHGYYTDVDRAWKRHALARQFAKSGINALFVACAAPSGPRDSVKWPSIGDLLDEVDAHETLPDGRLVVVGHSGAHRTLSMWLDDDRVATVVLLDALYGDMARVRDWVEADDNRRLIEAAALTRRWSDRLHAELSDTLVFDRFPRRGQLDGARSARVVYVRSQLDHMRLVTGGIAIPMLLRALQLPTRAARGQ